MRRALFAHWGIGLLLFLAAVTSGCKQSSAAQPPPNKPPPEAPGYVPAFPPDPGIRAADVDTRRFLLNSIHKSPLPLLEPEKVRQAQQQALKAISETFSDRFLPKELIAKVTLSQPECGEFGCSVDVTYPDSDYATFAAFNDAILARKADKPASPFMSFPGNRYRTGRVKIKGKTVASWILSFRLRQPEEYPGSKEGR